MDFLGSPNVPWSASVVVSLSLPMGVSAEQSGQEVGATGREELTGLWGAGSNLQPHPWQPAGAGSVCLAALGVFLPTKPQQHGNGD